MFGISHKTLVYIFLTVLLQSYFAVFLTPVLFYCIPTVPVPLLQVSEVQEAVEDARVIKHLSRLCRYP